MPYRFRRKISKSVAEVSTPNGRTIRLPYTGSLPNKGSIVQPLKNDCCCPTRLQFGDIPTRVIRTDPNPRRVSQRRPPPVQIYDRVVYSLDLLRPYVRDKPIYTVLTNNDGFYLPFTNKFPLVRVTGDPLEPYKEKLGVIGSVLYCFIQDSFDQWAYREPDLLGGERITKVKRIYVVDCNAYIKDYEWSHLIPSVYSALQQYHPGCALYTYRETGDRILPTGRKESMFDKWWRNPLDFTYKKWPSY